MNIKKIITIILIVFCMISLVSCIGEKDEAEQEPLSNSQQASSESNNARESSNNSTSGIPEDTPNQGNPEIELKGGESSYVVPNDSGTPDGFELGDAPNQGNPDIELEGDEPNYVIPSDSGSPDGFEVG